MTAQRAPHIHCRSSQNCKKRAALTVVYLPQGVIQLGGRGRTPNELQRTFSLRALDLFVPQRLKSTNRETTLVVQHPLHAEAASISPGRLSSLAGHQQA